MLPFYEEQKENLFAFKELVGTFTAVHPGKRAIVFETKKREEEAKALGSGSHINIETEMQYFGQT